MAGVGPVPGGARQRSRDEVVRELVKSDGKLGGYELPDGVLPFLPGKYQPDPENPTIREEWHPQTVRWWQNWRESPQGIRMATAVDWDYLLDTALLHHQMWQSGGRNSERAAEIRLRVATFGATPADRARLKFEIEVPDEFAAGARNANVSSMDAARRKKLIAGGE